MSRTGNSAKSLAGITLIEVLVAVVILFAGITAVLRAYSTAVTAMEAAAESLHAGEVLRRTIAGGEAHQEDCLGLPAARSRRGGFPSPDGLFRWSWDIRPIASAKDLPVAEMRVEVWRDGGRRHYLVATQGLTDGS